MRLLSLSHGCLAEAENLVEIDPRSSSYSPYPEKQADVARRHCFPWPLRREISFADRDEGVLSLLYSFLGLLKEDLRT